MKNPIKLPKDIRTKKNDIRSKVIKFNSGYVLKYLTFKMADKSESF